MKEELFDAQAERTTALIELKRARIARDAAQKRADHWEQEAYALRRTVQTLHDKIRNLRDELADARKL